MGKMVGVLTYGMEDIKSKMSEWGDGSRAQITVQWKDGNSGHTFSAEQINGETVFRDPQNCEFDASSYFDEVKDNKTQFARIDNLKPTKYINDCCIGRSKK